MTKSTKNHQPTKAPAGAGSNESSNATTHPKSDAQASLSLPPGVHRHTVPLALDEKAGLLLLKHPRFKQTQLRFNRKPPRSVLTKLVQLGWTWRRLEGVFTRQYGVQGEDASVMESRKL